MMIYTVTLNPSIDKALTLGTLETGQINRATRVRHDWGGKGINLSRAMKALGIESVILTVLAGSTGQDLRTGLVNQGFNLKYIEIPGQNRHNLTLFDQSTGQITKINEPGPTLTPSAEADLLTQVKALASPGDLWAFCGRLPPGASPELYGALIEIVQNQRGLAFLDTSGLALRFGQAAKPFAIKPNEEEAAEILERPIASQGEARQAVQNLMDQGHRLVALSRGPAGLILGYQGIIVQASPPRVEAVSPVGAGDAALAGLIWGFRDGCDPTEIAQRSVASGTAAAMQEGTGVGSRSLIEGLLPRIQLEILQS